MKQIMDKKTTDVWFFFDIIFPTQHKHQTPHLDLKMSSYTSSSSTESLLNKSSPPKKNYEAAFGQLQSTYGYAGGAPMPPSYPTPSAGPSRPSKPTPVVAPKAQSPPQGKNYEAAFGNLSSSYGFSGSASMLPKNSKKTGPSGMILPSSPADITHFL